MTNSKQALREKAINIFADIFAAGGEAHEVGGQSFDQLQQSGYIDRKLSDLISEHYYPKEFTEWVSGTGWQYHMKFKIWTLGMTKATTDELYEVWKENER